MILLQCFLAYRDRGYPLLLLSENIRNFSRLNLKEKRLEKGLKCLARKLKICGT